MTKQLGKNSSKKGVGMEIKEVIEHGEFITADATAWGYWTAKFVYKGKTYFVEFENYQAVRMNEGT
jgi:hypothetical protein